MPPDGLDLPACRQELEPHVRFAKVNMLTKSRASPGVTGIRGIPTLIVFDHGKIAKQQAGLVDIEFLRRLVQSPAI